MSIYSYQTLTNNSRIAYKTTHNSGFKKLAVPWLQEVQCFNQKFVVADSLELRNRQLLKPAKRWHQF